MPARLTPVRTILALSLVYCMTPTLLLAQADAEPEAEAAEPVLTAAEVRADLEELYDTLKRAHYDLYARRPKAEYDRLYAELKAEISGPMPRSKVLRAFREFVAFGRVAHASVSGTNEPYEQYRAEGGTAIPVSIRVVDGRVHVVEDYSGSDGLEPGDELLAINGYPMSRVLEVMSRQIAADNDYMFGAMLEHRFDWLIWEMFGARDSFRLTVSGPDGDERSITVPAVTREMARAESAQGQDRLNLDWHRREVDILSESLAYIRPGAFYHFEDDERSPWDSTAFEGFIDNAFERVIDAGTENLLIDLRDNPGGFNDFSDAMLAWFATEPFRPASQFRIRVSGAAIEANAARLPGSEPGSLSHQLAEAYAEHEPGDIFDFHIPLVEPREGKRYDGNVYVLINRQSYSNTANVAALVQDYGFATVLGEETSDLATTYGAMEHFELTHSGARVGFPKAYIVRPSGDETPRGVIPDITIPTPLVEPASDPVLQQAREIIKERD